MSANDDQIINFDDRPVGSSGNDVPEITLRQRQSDQDHFRRFWSLVLLSTGFFLSVIIDTVLLYYTKEAAWVTEAFSKTIVPILAFVLGASIKK